MLQVSKSVRMLTLNSSPASVNPSQAEAQRAGVTLLRVRPADLHVGTEDKHARAPRNLMNRSKAKGENAVSGARPVRAPCCRPGRHNSVEATGLDRPASKQDKSPERGPNTPNSATRGGSGSSHQLRTEV